MRALPLTDMSVLSFESRRATEIARLISGYGGQPISAPSMREIPLSDNEFTQAFLAELESGAIDIVILLTGVGTTALIDILTPQCPTERLRALLDRPIVVARGPKPRAVLRTHGMQPDLTVPEPNTWREIVDLVAGTGPLSGKRIAIQEYGRSNDELTSALTNRGATVLNVPVYRWALPEDLDPLRHGVRTMASGGSDVAVFTSAQQCAHVFEIARQLGLEPQVLQASETTVVASIGPVCSEALAGYGFTVDIEPKKPKMGPLIREIAEAAPTILATKRLRQNDRG